MFTMMKGRFSKVKVIFSRTMENSTDIAKIIKIGGHVFPMVLVQSTV